MVLVLVSVKAFPTHVHLVGSFVPHLLQSLAVVNTSAKHEKERTHFKQTLREKR